MSWPNLEEQSFGGVIMKKNESDQQPLGCPICGSEESIQIEFDRPIILLCECNNCKKFILRKETYDFLDERKDFNENRQRISDFSRDYFQKHKTPLEIVPYERLSIKKSQMTIEQIFKQTKARKQQASSKISAISGL